jgi:hypothetical protein
LDALPGSNPSRPPSSNTSMAATHFQQHTYLPVLKSTTARSHKPEAKIGARKPSVTLNSFRA